MSGWKFEEIKPPMLGLIMVGEGGRTAVNPYEIDGVMRIDGDETGEGDAYKGVEIITKSGNLIPMTEEEYKQFREGYVKFMDNIKRSMERMDG